MMDINDGYVLDRDYWEPPDSVQARYEIPRSGSVVLSDGFTAAGCAPVPLCPGSAHPCPHCIPTGAGSDAFRWMSRTLEPTNTTFSLSVISQFCAVVFQLLTSRRVRLKVTVLVSPGSSSTSSKPRRTPQGLSSPPSWTYWCVCVVSVQPAERWWIQGPCSYVNVPAAGSRSP